MLYIIDTWFKDKDDEIAMGNLQPEGYIFDHTHNTVKTGGVGIAVVYKSIVR